MSDPQGDKRRLRLETYRLEREFSKLQIILGPHPVQAMVHFALRQATKSKAMEIFTTTLASMKDLRDQINRNSTAWAHFGICKEGKWAEKILEQVQILANKIENAASHTKGGLEGLATARSNGILIYQQKRLE
ncbi:hypothetical protein C8J56DRAFT_1066405 [Mycena floridula]|nr:hypothetical protein C8J56DRAFT_1066405 [Mycena floridula]